MNRCTTRYAFCLLVVLSFFVSPALMAQKNKKKDQANNYQKQRNLNQAEYFFAEGMKFYILESYDKAIDLFQKALDINPDNAGANFAIADALAKSNKPAQAIPYAEKAVRLAENNKYYYGLLAQLYEKDKKLPQALKIYQELTKKFPDDVENYFDLANLYLYQEKYEDAIKAYDKVEKTIGLNEDIIRQKEQIYLKLNKPEAAIGEAKKLVNAYPEDTKYLIHLAQLYVTNDKSKEAIPLLEKIISEDPTNAQARLVLSDIYRNNGQAEKADRELETAFRSPELEADTKVQILASYMRFLRDDNSRKNALKLADLIIKTHPQEAKAYVVYGDLLTQAEEKEQARNIYVKASKLDNSTFEVWHQIIRLDAELNQMDSLTKHTDQALELFPNQGIFWFYNGLANVLKKDFTAAVEALEYAKKLSSSNKDLLTQINALLGDSYHGMNNYQKSDLAYEAALEIDPNNASVLNNYSYYLALRKEKLDRAKQMSSRLVEKNPDNPTYLDTHAWVLYTMKDYKQARKYLEKAAKDSTNGTILEHYGDVLFKLGETEKAMQQWMKAKTAGEASEMIDKKIAQKQLYE